MRNAKNCYPIRLGISGGLFGMSVIDSGWPLVFAVAMTFVTSLFIQGAEGATFAIIPFVKKRLTGQVSGMAGAYGNVGSVVYLTIYTFTGASTFFMILAIGAFMSFLFCLFLLDEPEDSFGEEYALSSVDREQQEALLEESS